MSILPVDYKYQLDCDTSYQTKISGRTVIGDWYTLNQNGLLTLKKGYAWNGATAAIDTDNFLAPSAVHDAFYQMIKHKMLPESFRAEADKELKRMCIEAGMSRFRAEYVYLAVRAFGGKFAR